MSKNNHDLKPRNISFKRAVPSLRFGEVKPNIKAEGDAIGGESFLWLCDFPSSDDLSSSLSLRIGSTGCPPPGPPTPLLLPPGPPLPGLGPPVAAVPAATAEQ